MGKHRGPDVAQGRHIFSTSFSYYLFSCQAFWRGQSVHKGPVINSEHSLPWQRSGVFRARHLSDLPQSFWSVQPGGTLDL